jgi:opacity protein-like surface antigen
MSRFKIQILLFLLLALSLPPLASADKTDIVVLKNGDKITGEVKGMLRGKLEFSTDSMGTVYIEWADIEAVLSDTGQSLELANGQRFFGPLRNSESSEMVAVETEQGVVGLNTLDVVAMYPVEASFWDRLEVSTSLGFSWDKGSSVGKYTLGLDAEYRATDHLTLGGLTAEVTTQDGQEDSRRASASISHMRFRQDKRFVSYFANADSNDELGIDLRVLGGIGYGWVPIRSNHNLFLLTAGADVNHEIPTEGDPETNVEGVLRVSYDYFSYSDPERTFGTALTVFPSITDFGRWRADFNTNFRLEFVDDLFWVMSLFANYDSEPVSEDASQSDYGVRSELAYKW